MRLMPSQWRLPLSTFLSLNSNLGRNLPFACVTILAIAAAVAMATSLEITSRALQADLSLTADAIAGDAEIEIVGGYMGVPEHLLERAAQTPGVARASPFMQSTFRLVGHETPIMILGVDLTEDRGVRDYSVERNGMQIRDPLRLLVRPESVIIAPALARRVGAALGSLLPVAIGERQIDLVVEGTLREGGLADAFSGQVAVMDVFSLQTLLHREGGLDRIDVDLEADADAETVLEALEAQVGDVATVRPSRMRESFIGTTLAMIRMATLVIAGIGAMVACMLSYAAISLSIARRAHELSILSSVGLEQRSLRRLVLLDCTTYSLLGTALGLALGAQLPALFVHWTGVLSPVEAEVDRNLLVVAPATWWIAAVVGVGAAAVGLFASLSEVGAPFDTRGRSGPMTGAAAHRNRWMLAGGALGVSVLLLPGLPGLARAGLFALIAIVLLMFSGPYLVSGIAGSRPLLERLLPRIGQLVGSGLAARPRTAAMTASSLGGVAAAVTTIFTFTASFEDSLVDYAMSTYPGAVSVSASQPFTSASDDVISDAAFETISSSPEAAGITESFVTTSIYRGREIVLIAIDMESLARFHPRSGVLADCLGSRLGGRRVGATSSFLRAFGLELGDTISMRTPGGLREFELVCARRSFSGPSGGLVLDMRTYDAHWPRLAPHSVRVWPRNDATALIDDLHARTRHIQPLFFSDGAALGAHARAYVARYNSALYTLAAIALTLGGIAMANSLIGVVAERKRDLELLRAAGASPRHLSSLVLADGAALALIGSTFGIGLGLIVSVPVTAAVGDAFGWSLHLSIDWVGIAALLAAMAATVLIACAIPMGAARNPVPGDMFEPG